MKRIYRACLLIICALSASCEISKVENPAPGANAGRPASGQNAAANNSERHAPAAPGGDRAGESSSGGSGQISMGGSDARPGASPETADFGGTAGITDKKYEDNGVAVLKNVRAAGHSGYDRVVFEFDGSQVPSYHIEYVDKPVRSCGSGDVVPLKGDGWLEIRFTPAAAHTEDGKPTVKDRAQQPNLKIVREIKSTCDFEAEVEWVLGVASPNKYRVLELKSPTRLAVDIKH